MLRAGRAQPLAAALDLDERLARCARSRAALAEAAPRIVDAAVAEGRQPRRFATREVECVGDSGLAGARPKIEQLVWARRVHRAWEL